MRYTIKQYAYVLLSVYSDKAGEEKREVIKRFLGVLRKNRDGPKLSLILQEAEKIHFKESGLRKIDLESASGASETAKKEISEILDGNLFFREKINPELLAGIRILIDGETLIDASAKKQMDRLFVK